MLNDPESARYTHALNISLAGEYTCTVSNNKPSSDSASITVTGIYFTLNLHKSVIVLQISGPQPPTDVAGVQDGPTSIRVTWTPPDPLDGVTGYRIHYTTGGGSSGSQTVSGGNAMTHTLTGLTNGETYTISIVATSSTTSSSTVMANMAVGLCKFTIFSKEDIFSVLCTQFLVSQVLVLTQQQPPPSPSPGVFPVALW